MNKIRWGIIGPGSIAHNFADALKQSYSGELLAIASRTSSRLEEFGNKYNINEIYRFNDYDKLLDDENIDAVYISTPHVFHADLSIKAAGKGKHILCEKPGALNFKQTSEVIEKVKEAEPLTSIWSKSIDGFDKLVSSIANRNVLLPPSALLVLSILLKTSIKVDPSVAEGV